eukprot:CAMPEP_0172574486 /NCGR_PEP_ID=MMETSP1067-20121228/136726_1 /TAXON_ID=265564 ORGANISM="Thalassiosira punctigera, Strain Tpunct2005C2" /NCGR_SAMPLE_ID=MMETSP1067 /ASSEMBLY_ACC=CAM_ASM_000444 /LENGTH=572 /DNA_ID=CAMNT_0013367115 /DNA_START=55 /DNA_END=1774 /DNA_ORIENTATION=-
MPDFTHFHRQRQIKSDGQVSTSFAFIPPGILRQHLGISIYDCSKQVTTIAISNREQYSQPTTRQFDNPSLRKVLARGLAKRGHFTRRRVLRSNIENDTELDRALESNDLDDILAHLRSRPSSVPSLTDVQLRSVFDAVEMATTESDENTVNKRAIEDANISSAGVEFRELDPVRAKMTELYRFLGEEGKLSVFGAVGRPSPPEMSVYPTVGSKIITPTLLEHITGIAMINLTPQPTNILLYGGAALALLEGVASLYFGVSFNLLVVITLLLALMDQILVSGAVSETVLRMVQPEMTPRITKHEAGHFLCAYLLGCPVEGVVLSTWAALNDERFGGRSGRAVSAGTSYYDIDLSEQIAGTRPLTRESIDRYSIIVMGGIAAEAVEYGRADGGAGDEEALVRFLRSLNPRSGNAVSAWTPELIRNQARWGATQAVLLLKEYKPCYDALVDALEKGGDLGRCVAAIEGAARREGLGRRGRPMGIVVEEGEFGRWVPVDEDEDGLSAGTNGRDGEVLRTRVKGSTSVWMEERTNVPTYGEDPITSTEEFLKKYRDVMEKKLAIIDEELEEMDKEQS